MKFCGIKNKKLCFRTVVSSVGKPGKLQITFSALSNGTRVKRVTFFGNRIDSAANQTQCRLFGERIHPEPGSIRNQEHVRLVNCSPAADRRRVKSESVFELIFAKFADGKG